MRKRMKELNYETLGQISAIISQAKDLGNASEHIVGTLTQALGLKGAALLLYNRRSNKLEKAAATGLSETYLSKGPISAERSIAASLREGPVAITDVEDDPRLQYPEEAVREGIRSIVSVPMILRGKPLGVLRLYSAETWEVSMAEMTFLQAVAEIIALVLDNIRISHAYKTSIEVLKVLRPVIVPRSRRTLHE